MRVLSLFSGGGLGDYGLELAGFEIVGQVEIDDYCQKILALRWPNVPKWRDIRTVHTKETCLMGNSTSTRSLPSAHEGIHRKKESAWPRNEKFERRSGSCSGCIDLGRIDLISGGFPCQDISTAGRGAGITGERSGLWKEMLRIIREVRPRYVLVENVTALLGRGLGVVLGDLAESGYDTEWDCIPASAVGAPHQRDRIWIVAYANGSGRREQRGPKSIFKKLDSSERNRQACDAASERLPDWSGGNMGQPSPLTEFERSDGKELGHAERSGRGGKSRRRPRQELANGHSRNKKSKWGIREIERDFRGVAHGVANRVDRLKLLGNGQVVQVVEIVGKMIIYFDKTRRA